MNRWNLISFFWLFLLGLPAQANTKLPSLLAEIQAKYAKAGTLEAQFTQVNTIAALKQKKTSSGRILAKRPNKVRWETLKPDPNLLVSDGKKFWFYTPPFDEDEHGQVIERKASDIQSKLANALLAGSFSTVKGMKIQQESETRFMLIPKPGTAGSVMKAEVDVNPAQKTIEKVTLEHQGGNRSEITLSQIELGKPLENKLFEFTAPSHTDRVDE